MKRKRGRVVLAGFNASLPDLVCRRAVDRASEAKLIFAPGSLPIDLCSVQDAAAVNEIKDELPLRATEKAWQSLIDTIDAGGRVLRWYPDNPLATDAGRQDVADLRESGIGFEIVPAIPPEIIGATFAEVPLPAAPRTVELAGPDRDYDLAINVGVPGSRRTTAGTTLVNDPGTSRQKTGDARDLPVQPGTIAFTGAAAERRQQPNWFESLPLFGKRVLVTRPRAQAPLMARLLRQLGAEPIELPAIEIVPNPYPERTRQAIQDLPGYDWVVFTSANGVEIFLDQVLHQGYDVRRFGDAHIAAIGSGTANRLREYSIEADFVPDEFVAEAVVEGLRSREIDGKRVLLPRAEVARDTLPEGLRDIGATVDVVPVYRTIPGRPEPAILRALDSGEIDIVTFTSSSTVDNLIGMLDGEIERLSKSRIACIGPITAETARARGLEVSIIPDEYSVPGLIDAICTSVEGAT
jgi:uroporphyrinogen-III synthase